MTRIETLQGLRVSYQARRMGMAILDNARKLPVTTIVAIPGCNGTYKQTTSPNKHLPPLFLASIFIVRFID
jgi:hypothetical protein